MVKKAIKLKIIKEDLILHKFYNDDILIAINSLSCRQINRVNDIEFTTTFDTKYFWEFLYKLDYFFFGKKTSNWLFI